MKSHAVALLGSVLVLLSSSADSSAATITFTNGGGDSLWTTTSNWSPAGVPTSTSDVVIGTLPSNGGTLEVNTVSSPADILSLTYASSLAGTSTLETENGQVLEMNGNITNSSASHQNLTIAVFAAANATYSGGSAGINFGDLTLGDFAVPVTPTIIHTAGTITITNHLVFQLNTDSATNLTTTTGYSQVIQNSGTLNVSGGTLTIGGIYTGNAGDFFQLVTTGAGGSVLLPGPSGVDTSSLPLSALVTPITSLINKGILFFQPTAGGNLINAGFVYPIGNDTEFNPIGTAATDVTLNGGEILTSNNGALDTNSGVPNVGAGSNSNPFTTTKTFAVNTTGGTIAATTGTTATYGGVISNGNGSTGVLAIGASGATGTIVFSANNTFGGGSTIFTGTTLQVGTGGAAGTFGTGNVANSGSLIIDRNNAYADGGAIISGGGTLTVEGGGTFTITATDTYTGSTTVTGAGTGLVVNGSTAAGSALSLATGTTLSGTGTVHGTTSLTSATVNGSGLILTGIVTANGAGNILSGSETASNGVTLASGAALADNAVLTGNMTVGNGTLTGTGSVSGTTSVTGGTVNGNGLILTGVVTANGAGNILLGSETATNGVTLASGAALADNAVLTGNMTVGNGTLTGTGSVSGTTSVTGGTVNGNGLILTGVVTANGAGNILLGSETATNGVTLASGAALADDATLTGNMTVGNGTLTGTGSVSGTTSVTGGTVNGNGLILTGVVTANGAGNILLRSETATNGVTLASGAALADDATLTGNMTVGNGTLTGTGSVSGTTSVTGGTVNGNGLILTGVVTANGAGNILLGSETATNGVTLAAGAALADNATLTGNMTVGNGTLTGTGSVSGTTSVTGGTVNGNGLILTGATTFNGAGNMLSGTETATNGVTIAAGAALTQTGGVLTGSVTDLSAATSTFSGAIGGVGKTVTMNNAGGTLIFSGANTYTGPTSIMAGTVDLSGTGSLGNTAVSIANGATLSVLGTSNSIGGGITDSGGLINLQNNAINTLSGSTLAGNGTLSIDVGSGGTSDKIALTGAASLAANAYTINVASLAGATTGTAYTFISAGSGLAASDFTLGTVTGGLTGDIGVFTLTGNTVTLTFTAANGYYYTGAADTVLSNLNNYTNQASGGTVPTVAISGTTNIFIGSTSPAPTNITPAVTTNLTINSLTFTPTGSGALVSGGSTLTINNGVTVLSGAAGTETISAPVALGGNQTWTVTDAASTLNDSGGISGAFALTKAGAGTLILTSADTFSGPTVVNAGALRLANANSLGGSSSVTVNSGGVLQLAGGLTFTAIPTTLNGAGLAGAGALESFTGVNTYASAITLGSNASIGADTGSTLNLTGATLSGSGLTLTLVGAGDINISSAIATGTGGLTMSGTGIDTLTGANTFTGATMINSGTLAIGAGGSLALSSGVNLAVSGAIFDLTAAGASQTIQDLNGAAGTMINLGTNTLTAGTNNATADVFSGVISGTGGFTKIGTDTLTLGGTNIYTGLTTITAGTLQVNGSTAAGSTVNVGTAGTLSGSGTVNGNATLTGNGTINLASSGIIAGTLGVTGGKWNGAGSVTGAVTSSSGTFTIGNGANLTANGGLNVTGGSIAAASTTSTITGNVNYTSTTSSIFNGVIAGANKTLILNSTGTTLTLGGTNTYTGATTDAAGTLAVMGSTATGSAVTIGNNTAVATLAGTGTLNGSVALVSTGANVAHLAPGATPNTAGTLHLGSLNIGAGSALDIDLSSNAAPGGSNDLIALNGGTLTFGGQTIVDLNALSALTAGSTYTLINGAGSVAGFNANSFTVNGLANNLEATFSDTASSLLVTFNTVPINAYYYTGAASAGNFNTAGNYQSRPSGGTTETVNLGASTGSIDVYIGATTPAPTANPSLALSQSASINSLNFTPSGAGGSVTGAFTLTIGTGGVVVQTGVAGTETISAAVALGANQTWTVTDLGSTLLDSGGISGGFGLTKIGAGTLILGGTNTYTGPTAVMAGTLQVNGSTAAGSALTLAAGTTLSGSGTVGGTTTATGATISGTGLTLDGLTTFSAGANTLSGSETASGGVAITGTATVAQTGTLTASNLTDTSSGASTFAGTIAGAAAVTLNNAAGTLTLSGNNTYTGGTVLTAGRLDITGAGTLGANTNTLSIGNGILDLGTTTQTVGAVTFSGTNLIQNGTLHGTSYSVTGGTMTEAANAVLSGAGTFSVSGGSTVTLNGANTYTGGTTLTSGNLFVDNPNALGTGLFTQNGGNFGTSGTGGLQINLPGGFMQTGGTLTLQMNATPVAGRNALNDFLNVTGNAVLDGTALAVKFNFVPLKGEIFDLISATNLTGTALLDPVISPAGFKVSVALTGTDDSITVTQTSLALAALLSGNATPNQTAILNYIDSNVVSGPLFTAISSTAGVGGALSAQTAQDVANQFNPVKFANVARATVFNNAVFSTQLHDSYISSGITENGEFASGNGKLDYSNLTVVDPSMDSGLATIGSHLLAWSPAPLAHGMLSDSPAPVLGGVDLQDSKAIQATGPMAENNFNVYVAGNVVLAQTFSDPDLAHSDQTTGGVQMGADYRLTPHLRAGAMFSYNYTDADLDTNGSKSTLDSYAPGVYVAYAQDGWYANALGVYGFDSFTEDRHISIGGFSSVAHGAPTGDQITGNLDGGYDFHLKALTYGPLLGVQYTHLDVDSYTEDGANALAADESVSKQEADSLRSRLGGHVSYDFHTGKIILTPHLEAAWQHEFMDQAEGLNATIVSPATTGSTPFTVRTPDPSRDSALLDCGINAQLCGQVSVFSDYVVQVGQSNYFGQSVQAGVKIGF